VFVRARVRVRVCVCVCVGVHFCVSQETQMFAEPFQVFVYMFCTECVRVSSPSEQAHMFLCLSVCLSV
jgi:hypothetical protein